MEPGFAPGCAGSQSFPSISLQIPLQAHSLSCVSSYFWVDLRASSVRLHSGLGSEDAPHSAGRRIRISPRTEIPPTSPAFLCRTSQSESRS